MCIIIKHVENCDKSHHFFYCIIIYIYFFFYKRCYVSNHPDTQHKMVDWISEGEKKKKEKN